MQFLDRDKAIKTCTLIYQAGKKLDQRVHQVACSGINHYLNEGSGDTCVLTTLVHSMPKSGRTNALKFWITKHCNVRWDPAACNGQGGYVKIKKGKDHPPEGDIVSAVAHPFYEKPDTEKSVWNPHDSMLRLVKRLRKDRPDVSAEKLLQEVLTEVAA